MTRKEIKMSKFKRFFPFVYANEKGNYFGDKTTTVDGVAYEYNIALLGRMGYYSPESFMDISKEDLESIYEIYWEDSKSEHLPEFLCRTHFDFYFNKPSWAMKSLQQTCNEFLPEEEHLLTDGKIGPKSFKGLDKLFKLKLPECAILNTYNMLRMCHYTELLYNTRKIHGNRKTVDFILSWSNRVKELYSFFK